MILGSLMLIKSDVEFYQISFSVMMLVITTTAAAALLIVGMGIRAMRRSPKTGREGMIGAIGIARTSLIPDGKLALHGELWDAVSDTPIEPGKSVKVLRGEGLTLFVTPVTQEKEA